MQTKKALHRLFMVLSALGFVSLAVPCQATDQEKTLYNFDCPSHICGFDSAQAGVIFDKAGNLYGTYVFGGTSGSKCLGTGCGYVFELTPNPDGSWTETTLYNFCSALNCADGASPYSGLTLDNSGNLYGTTLSGGSSATCGSAGCGTVFKLTHNADGTWTEAVLYSFTGGADGVEPVTKPLFDLKGNLYGTTQSGGSFGHGTVFELIPDGAKWKETILHTFNGTDWKDGIAPVGLAFDQAGNLYGTTILGGKYAGCPYGNDPDLHCGTVYRLAPDGDGTWKESILLNFNVTNGELPYSGVVLDASGNLYGVTPGGGKFGWGVVFQIVHGTWKVNHLLDFSLNNGAKPYAPLTFDAAGNLFGTTLGGGASNTGVAFELSPGTKGWTETVLYNFSGDAGSAAKYPNSVLTFDASGNIYGVAAGGGTNHSGAVFAIF